MARMPVSVAGIRSRIRPRHVGVKVRRAASISRPSRKRSRIITASFWFERGDRSAARQAGSAAGGGRAVEVAVSRYHVPRVTHVIAAVPQVYSDPASAAVSPVDASGVATSAIMACDRNAYTVARGGHVATSIEVRSHHNDPRPRAGIARS